MQCWFLHFLFSNLINNCYLQIMTTTVSCFLSAVGISVENLRGLLLHLCCSNDKMQTTYILLLTLATEDSDCLKPPWLYIYRSYRCACQPVDSDIDLLKYGSHYTSSASFKPLDWTFNSGGLICCSQSPLQLLIQRSTVLLPTWRCASLHTGIS